MIDIVDEDQGFDEFLDKIEMISKSGVDVGYTDTAGDIDGFKIVDLAITQELGNDNIPARPHVRLSFDNNEQEIGDTGIKLLSKYIEDKIDAQLTHEIWGDGFKEIVQKGVITRSLGLEDNAQSTIDKKGSDTPLIDTGRMINSIQVLVDT